MWQIFSQPGKSATARIAPAVPNGSGTRGRLAVCPVLHFSGLEKMPDGTGFAVMARFQPGWQVDPQ
jgi:hypothetical protein